MRLLLSLKTSVVKDYPDTHRISYSIPFVAVTLTALYCWIERTHNC